MLDFDLIETPENVELQRPLAGIGSRFIAGFIDNIIIALAYLIIFIIVIVTSPFGLTGSFEDITLDFFWVLIILFQFLMYWGYFSFFEWITNGQSPGKKNQKIRVAKEGGGPITFTDTAIRNLLRVIDFLPFGYAVGGISMFVTKRSQRLGDLAAGTITISEQLLDYRATEGKGQQVELNQEISASAIQQTGLTFDEFRIIQNYYNRRNQLTIDARRNLLPRLIQPILQRLGHTEVSNRLEVLESYIDFFIEQSSATGDSDPAWSDKLTEQES